MKYIFLIPDGAADWPIKDLGNKTVLQTAKTPHMDKLAWLGKMGMLKTIPEGMTPGSECANMAIMGYRPEKDLTGRGPLEALSAGVEMQEHHLAFRCNIITIEQGRIKDYSSGHITTEESRPLVKYLQENLGERYEGIDFFPGVQYRHILRMDGNKFSEEINLTPPHDELDQLYREHLPKAKNKANKKAKETAEFITSLIEESNQFLESHEINKKRQSAAKNMATHIWPWSGGKKPQIEPMKEKYGLNGSVISAVDLIFGLGIAAGLKPIHVEGATGLPDTNYEGKIQTALKALNDDDFVYLHVEAPDEMGHAGDAQRKINAIEDFDQKIVKPCLEAQKEFKDKLVIVLLPDHPTPIEIRTHSPEPIPFVIYNPEKVSEREEKREFSEESGKNGELGVVENGEEFMKLVLKIGGDLHEKKE